MDSYSGLCISSGMAKGLVLLDHRAATDWTAWRVENALFIFAHVLRYPVAWQSHGVCFRQLPVLHGESPIDTRKLSADPVPAAVDPLAIFKSP